MSGVGYFLWVAAWGGGLSQRPPKTIGAVAIDVSCCRVLNEMSPLVLGVWTLGPRECCLEGAARLEEGMLLGMGFEASETWHCSQFTLSFLFGAQEVSSELFLPSWLPSTAAICAIGLLALWKQRPKEMLSSLRCLCHGLYLSFFNRNSRKATNTVTHPNWRVRLYCQRQHALWSQLSRPQKVLGVGEGEINQ